MSTGITAEKPSSDTSESDALPTLALAQLKADAHGVFRRYRREYPVVRHENGSYFVLRFTDIDRLSKDPRLGPTRTALPEMLGLSDGTIFDVFLHGMLTADGDVHRRRRAPFSRLFAARARSPRCAREYGARPKTLSMDGMGMARWISSM